MHLGAIEVVVIAAVIFVLFGYRKLPAAMRALKEGMNELKRDGGADETSTG
ncbi:MAG: twin-arginine translocase TatA/TatE family subunit [Lachnospiraceae bacterium]|nr:twin-arginine translocase TatA/TatE family subunit [Lachnospiraceae bacterium]